MNLRTTTLSLEQLRNGLRAYQKRLRAGDMLPPLKELSAIAGLHRDTLYALLAGERVNERSQYAISKALAEVMESQWNQPSRLLSIDLAGDGPRLKFGLTNKNILSRR
jgi:hypothetical protein